MARRPTSERAQAIEAFLGSDGARVFLATDAASEGINLQKAAHHLVHLDVPWNPNRYIQRTARIDRYGQGERPHVWAFVASDRRGGEGRPEARALEVVVEKFERIAEELGSVGFSLPGCLHQYAGPHSRGGSAGRSGAGGCPARLRAGALGLL